MAVNFNDPNLLTDPQYRVLLANLGLTDELAKADQAFYAARNQRDEGRMLPQMARTDALQHQNLGLGYEQNGLARSSVRQAGDQNLTADQNYAMEGAKLGFADRGIDLQRGLAANLAESDRQRALGYGDVMARTHDQALRDQLYAASSSPVAPASPMGGAPADPYKIRYGRAF